LNSDLLNILNEELKLLDESAKTLEYSLKVCKSIGIKKDYTEDELESFEALCSRFSRLSDIMIQKILKTIDIIDLETPGTVRDRINRAYKKELITSDEELVEIRILRNEIAHEYIPEAFKEIFSKVINYSPSLINNVNKIKSYCSIKYKVNG